MKLTRVDLSDWWSISQWYYKKPRLILSPDNLLCIKWYMDESFAVDPDYKSHTGPTISFEDGEGAEQSISWKQRLYTKSSI